MSTSADTRTSYFIMAGQHGCVCARRGPDAAAVAAAEERQQQLSVCPKITRPRSHVLARPGLTNDIIIIIIAVQL